MKPHLRKKTPDNGLWAGNFGRMGGGGDLYNTPTRRIKHRSGLLGGKRERMNEGWGGDFRKGAMLATRVRQVDQHRRGDRRKSEFCKEHFSPFRTRRLGQDQPNTGKKGFGDATKIRTGERV